MSGRRRSKFEGLCLWTALAALLLPLTARSVEDVLRQTQAGLMLTKEGGVAYLPRARTETNAVAPQDLDYGDALRTRELGRATVRFVDWSEIRIRERTRLEIQRRPELTNQMAIKLEAGQIYVSNRGRGARTIPIITPHARGVPQGTEFLVSVDAVAGQTEVTMFDGEVELSNGVDSMLVKSGEQGVAAPNQPIVVRPILQGQNIVQWWIYYPGILDANELGLTAADEAQLAVSLAAYRQGDLRAALESFPGYPAPVAPASEPLRVYLAGLFLAVGAVDRTEVLLNSADTSSAPAQALRTLIAAVTSDWSGSTTNRASRSSTHAVEGAAPRTASEHLALSYSHQATHDLRAARDSARRAVALSPGFGFGWARVAELEFSFGNIRAAGEAAAKSMTLTPRHAQAQALHGFLLAAANRTQDALRAFDEAIRLDPALGNAWLGRGLCKRRLGWLLPPELLTGRGQADWLGDVQTAAILEPTRSLARSYAGKAFGDSGDLRLAEKELAYAKRLDTNDPTPWLYSALNKHRGNRANEAIDDLERSLELNDNRALFRSRLLLDQDQGIRATGLARLYRDAGLEDVALREAARAVSYDYANYSAHQFLAESYDALRDPTRFDLRYETVWFNELLLANLLSPVGAGLLSQNISQQEYTRLFEHNRLGRLRVLSTVIGEGVLHRLKEQSPLGPFHRSGPNRRASPNPYRPT